MKKFSVKVNGISYEVEVEELGGAISTPSAAPAEPAPAASAPVAAAPAPSASVSQGSAGATKINAPMPGTIVSVNVSVGDTVSEGQVVAILEAMKMENEIMAPKAGKVASVNVTKGASVNSGDLLVSLA